MCDVGASPNTADPAGVTAEAKFLEGSCGLALHERNLDSFDVAAQDGNRAEDLLALSGDDVTEPSAA